MKTIIIANSVVFAIVCGVRIFIGLDLRKWSSWLYGVYGFLSGFFVGLLWADLHESIIVGALFAIAVMYGGATTHWHRQRYKE